jgi:hypothetical protein
MPLLRISEPFTIAIGSSSRRWTASSSWRTSSGHGGTLVSRNGIIFGLWTQLAEEVAQSRRGSGLVQRGVCEGRPWAGLIGSYFSVQE